MSEERVPPSAYTAGQGDPVPRYRRNPRRAYDRDGREIRPMDLANAADNGVTMLRAFCPPPCRHDGLVPLAASRRPWPSGMSGCACDVRRADGRAPRLSQFGRGGIEHSRRPDPVTRGVPQTGPARPLGGRRVITRRAPWLAIARGG